MIEEAIIVRFADHPKLGAPGELFVEGVKYCNTLEKPWVPIKGSLGGKPFESCVPAGVYQVEKFHSEDFGDCFILLNTLLDVYAFAEDRTAENQRYKCLFAHRGSLVKNFQGCIGLGRHYTLIHQEMGISDTKNTVEKLMHLFYKENLQRLVIKWKHGDCKDD